MNSSSSTTTTITTPAGEHSIREFQDACSELLQYFSKDETENHENKLMNTFSIDHSNESLSHQEEILACILSNLDDICDCCTSQKTLLRSIFSPCQVGETGWVVDPRKLSCCLLTLTSHRSRLDDIGEGDDSELGNVDIPYTITPLSLNAARLYLELCQFRGAWSMGWMDVCLLRNIEALVRRWGEESRGKKIALYCLQQSSKKKKKKSQTDMACHDDDDDDDDNPNDSGMEENEKGQSTGRDSILMMGGFKLCSSISKVLKCHDFWNWSKDIRDALLDSSVCALGISSSLIVACDGLHVNHVQENKLYGVTNAEGDAHGGVNDDEDHHNPHEHNRKRGLRYSKIHVFDSVDFGNHVVNALMSAIENCVRKKLLQCAQQQSQSRHDLNAKDVTRGLEDDLMSVSPPLSEGILSVSPCSTTEPYLSCSHDVHEMILTFLRAVYPILTYQVDLPNGVKGKNSAYHHSSALVMRLLKCAVKHCNRLNRTSRITGSVKHGLMEATPAKTPKSSKYPSSKSPYSMDNKIPRSQGKNRSIDGIQIIPPSLKKNAITPRSRRRDTFGKDDEGTQAVKSSLYSNSSSILGIFIGLMQRLSIYKGNDKAEVRTRHVEFLKICLCALPLAEKKTFFQFAVNLCISKISYHRIFGVELIGACFLMDCLWVDQMESFPSHDNCLQGQHTTCSTCTRPKCSLSSIKTGGLVDEMLTTIIGRLNDKAPAVRTRAASVLSCTVNNIHTLGNLQIRSKMINCISNSKLGLQRLLRTRATSDDKASVRRSAILTLGDLLLVENEPCTKADMAVFKDGCNDVSVSVRKSTIDCIVSLIQHNQKTNRNDTQQSLQFLEKSWIDFVLPLVYDTENSVATKVADSFLQIIIDPFLDVNDDEENSISCMKCLSAWRILCRLNTSSWISSSGSGGQRNLTEVLRKSLEMMNAADQQHICVAIFRQVHSNITRELKTLNSDLSKSFSACFVGSWCLLEAISFFYSIPTNNSATWYWDIRKDVKKSAIGTKFLVDSWNGIFTMGQQLDTRERTEYVASAKSCLSVISSMSLVLSEEEANTLLLAIRSSHVKFHLAIPLIGPSISAMVRIYQRLYANDVASAQQHCKNWIIECLGQCENILSNFFADEYHTTEPIALALYTVGELMLVGFSSGCEENNQQHTSKNVSKGSKLSVQDINVTPTQNLLRLVQSLLLPTLPRVNGVEEQRVIPQSIRAHAFLSFGKMCLRDESLARASINIFARELRQDKEYSAPAVKSNALTILGDFCIRYTNLVDKFVPLMASCLQPFDEFPSLQDSESVLRRHAIIILSNLILQDYIKWKGVLFYRFLAATVDEDTHVAQQAKMMLCGPLLSKQPALFFNNFIDAVFILNGCTAHPLYKNRNSRDTFSGDVDGLDIFRISNTAKREEIYSLLIDYLSDEEKIGVAARLSKEILSAATEMQGELRFAANKSVDNLAQDGEGAFSVLSDCFQILVSPKMQMYRSTSASTLSTDEDEADYSTTNVSTITNVQVANGPSTSQLTSAKGKLLSKISRKHLIEIVLPIVCNLKIIFEKSRSPLLKNLMQYLVCIFRQFKKEVNETLASNPTLLQEIHYDTKKFEKDQRLCETHLSQSLVDVAVT